MPLQEIALPYLPSRVATKYLKSNNKLLSEDEIAAVIEGLKDKPDGRYRKEIFNRVQMPTHLYGIIKHQDDYYAIYSKYIYKFPNVIKVKVAQDLSSGEWLRLKVHSNKLEAENEFNYLDADNRKLAICYFSRKSRKDPLIEKYYILTKIRSGVDLTEFIQMDKYIPAARCVELAIDILKKVKAIHDDGYLLCKLTTDNILCDAANNAVSICDFDSISKMNAQRQAVFPITSSDIYLAPEIFEEFTLISLLNKVEATLAKGDKLTKAKLLEILDDPKFILSKLRDVKKAALAEKFRQLTKDEIEQFIIRTHANDRITYTYSEQTDIYSVGTILKVLFNIPVEEINKSKNNEDVKHFKIGKHKSFVEHGPITKWLDGMTAKHPDSRISIADVLAFFEEFYRNLLPLTQVRVGIIDIGDFNESVQVTTYTDDNIPISMANGFWDKTFPHLIQQMDEIYIVAKQADYANKIKIQRGLVRLGVLYNKDIIHTPTVDDLVATAAHIKQKHHNRNIHSFTYFDFSQYSQSENSFYTLHAVKENGISSPTNGLHANGHQANGRMTIYLTPPQTPATSPQPEPQRLLITPDKVREILIKHGINVITIDVKKTLAFYSLQLAQCLTTVTAEQFETLRNHLNAEIKKCETERGSPRDFNHKLIRMKQALEGFAVLKDAKALSYAIAHATLDALHQEEKTGPSASARGFFARSTVYEELQANLKMPEESMARHAR
jgi:serine/threonine protein kinase